MKQLFKQTKGDQVIWAVVIFLSVISLLTVYSATGSLVYKKSTDANHFLVRQIAMLGTGLIIIYLVHRINYARLSKVVVFAYRKINCS